MGSPWWVSGTKACGNTVLPPKAVPSDKGYPGCDEGYFDAQGYGEALDYCRWVGNGGCRREPSWWSCKLAGTTEEYTPKGDWGVSLPPKAVPSDEGYPGCDEGYFDAQGYGE